MAQLLLHNARVILESGVQHGGVLIRDRRIALVFAREQTPAGLSASETIDLGGAPEQAAPTGELHDNIKSTYR